MNHKNEHHYTQSNNRNHASTNHTNYNHHHRKNNPAPMPHSVKRGLRAYVVTVLTVTAMSAFSMTALASTDPLAVVNNLSDFIFQLIRAIGLIMLGFGIVQIGLSLKSHDPSQRANGILTVAGGIVIVFVKEILTLITG